jgi:hypothetical protein
MSQMKQFKIASLPSLSLGRVTRRAEMQNGPAEYRKMAELCRHYAKDLNNARDRERWLKIAEGWMVLARDTIRARNFTTAAKLVVVVVSEQRA